MSAAQEDAIARLVTCLCWLGLLALLALPGGCGPDAEGSVTHPPALVPHKNDPTPVPGDKPTPTGR